MERARRNGRQSTMSRLARTRLLVPTAAALALVLSGCGSPAPVAGTGATSVDGEWTLVSSSLSSVDPTALAATPITLTVDGSDVSGRSACNSYFGTLATAGAALHITGLGGTDMACEPAVMTLESAYLAALALVDTAAVADQLTLSGAGTELVFEPAAAPIDKPFVGTGWLLESLVGGGGADGTVSSSAAAAEIRFDADGTVTGSTGCGPFVGRWDRVGGKVAITFGDVPVPPGDIRPAPCLPDATAQLDLITRVLSEPFGTRTRGDLLTVTAADGSGLVYRAQAADPADDPATESTAS